MKLTKLFFVMALIAILTVGCKKNDDDDVLTSPSPPPPVNGLVGDYVDNYSGAHTISASHWLNGNLGFTITKINSSDKYLIAKNDSSNAYNADKYSRFDWVTDSTGDLYYCQSAYDKDDAAAAAAVDTADSTSPSTTGCGDFAWNQLTEFDEVAGEYTDNWSGSHTVSATRWQNGTSGYAITKIKPDDDYFVAQNDATNTYGASKYSRFDWTEDSSGNLYYCQTAYDEDSAADAEAVDTTDNSDPTSSGCGGFAWTQLTAFSEITGNFTDDWSGTHLVSATRWLMGTSGFSVTKINSTSDYFVAQNDSGNSYNADKYSRFDWAKDANNDLYYCQSAYDEDDAAAAEAVDTADSSDLTGTGCNGFAWTKLAPFSEAIGEFTDDYSYPHSISAARWVNGTNGYTITKINTSDDYYIAQNDAGNAYNPSKYSRFDWAEDSNGDLYYCQTAYDKDDATAAEAVETADSSELTEAGCSGFAWSKLATYP